MKKRFFGIFCLIAVLCVTVFAVSCNGGESTAELQQRFLATVDRVVKHHPNQTVCVATHATALRSAQCYWEGLPVEDLQQLPWPPNSSLTVVRYEEDGRFTLVKKNVVDHLGDSATFVPTNLV